MSDNNLRQRAWDAAAAVVDPEIPVLTIADLGVLRDVEVGEDGVTVAITPTYTGCPAMNMIAFEVEIALARAGIPQAKVRQVMSPAWTTDWMSEAGRRKLREYGIAPPGPAAGPVKLSFSARCPHCGSADTREVSHFGSTPCKALWTCRSCAEPFESFKAI